MKIDCTGKKYDILNKEIKAAGESVVLENCLGQRFIAAGVSGRNIDIYGVPGNALGAYLDGARIEVFGNAQDATGDTMNDGRIVVHGSCGDAAGYAMRGGEIYVEHDVGYRAGIHMKAYADKNPVIVIGGKCGSFLGEYQAGGTIIALGLGCEDSDVLGYFCGTGMHGGKIFVRCNSLTAKVAKQVCVTKAEEADLADIKQYISEYCRLFGVSEEKIYSKGFFMLAPNTSNPYNQLYIQN